MATTDSQELFAELHRLGRQLHRFAHRSLAYGRGQYREHSRFFRIIAEHDGIIQRDLAEEMDVRPSSMTEMLAKLEGLGLVARSPDERDQRVQHIHLTEAGKAIAERSETDTSALTDQAFAGLTEDEIATMLVLTRKLCANLAVFDEEDGPHWGRHAQHRRFGEEGPHRHHHAWHLAGDWR